MKAANRLYFGDCLDVMREDIADESIDLIYLDPPFNSKRLYNAFIGNAQWVAFDDTWRWHEAVEDFHQVVSMPGTLADTMEGLCLIHGEGPTLAYLSYMANRLRECWRVLKPTGSIYLHCDPTMSHSLKLVMDGIFGRRRFQNEVIWSYRRYTAFSKRFQREHDCLLFYAKGAPVFHPVYEAYGNQSGTKDSHYKRGEDGRWYRWQKRKGATAYKVYLSHGRRAGDVWVLSHINASAKERVGYPTQKPLKLLNRIIEASSNSDSTVLDPFCGCGTTVHAAQVLGRHWIGIDICVNACKVVERRLQEHFDSWWSDVEFIGLPKTHDHAKELASMDKFRFERWAAALVDGVEPNKRQRGDRGIDGWGRFPIRKGKFIDLVSQVKGGGTGPGDVQAFNGARQQAGADLGIFTCFQERVTPRMRDAAASTGRFMEVPKVQIYTIEDFFDGRKPAMPKVA